MQAIETLWDMKALSELREVLGDDVVEVFEEFRGTAPDMIERLAHAATTGNAKLVMEIAHSLKGMSGNIGAMGLYQLCHQLEAEARVGQVQQGEKQVARIAETYAQTQESMDGLLTIAP